MRFRAIPRKQQVFWKSIGIEMPAAETLKVSLFAYENAALPGLFDAWAAGTQPVLCLVPEGRILPQVGQYFGDCRAMRAASAYARGSLQVRVLPFVEQERYDELLWACDVNFVRGEDSFVRAQWAGTPFVWQIYPQHDAVHLKKLEAFLMLYGNSLASLQTWRCRACGRRGTAAVTRHWRSKLIAGAAVRSPLDTGRIIGIARRTGKRGRAAWPAFIAARGELERHTQHWARHLAENNLALNLLDFCREIGRMRALKIEGQQT